MFGKVLSGVMAVTMVLTSATVSVFAEEGDSPSQPEKNAVSETPVTLDTPKITKVSRSSSKVRLTWTTVKGADGYKVYKRNRSGWKLIKTVNNGKTECVVRKLDSHKKYSFRVRAYSKKNKPAVFSGYSDVKSVKTKYGKGYSNFSCKDFSLRFDPDKWNQGDGYPWSSYVRLEQVEDDGWLQVGLKVEAEDVYETLLDKDLDYFVNDFINELATMHSPDYFELTGYKKMCGLKWAVLRNKRTPDMGEVLMALDNKRLYTIKYGWEDYNHTKEDDDPTPYKRDIKKVLKTLKITHPRKK